jgi:hypothetical protein
MHRFQMWREALVLAPDVRTVHGLMRDYVQAIGPMIPLLPPESGRVLQGDLDVQAIAVALLREELRFEGQEEDRNLLHEVAHTFAAAAVRITLLHPRPAVNPA